MKLGLAAGVCALGGLAAACSSGSNVCSPANCTACCDFNGASARGVCVGLDFQSPATCGIGGVVCAACAQGMACSLGSCVPVTVSDAGVDGGPSPLCVADGGSPQRCGTAADCACGNACELGIDVCTPSCFENQPCNVGCCDLASGTCVGGTLASSCGALGLACGVCNADAGLTCEAATGGGVCGCVSTADCPPSTACDSTSGTCTAPCGKPGEGCCAPEACGVGSFCEAGFCAFCGGPGNRCCPDGTCSDVIGLACVNGTCQVCGGVGQPCCSGNLCNTPCCLEQVLCVSAGASCPGVDGGTCGIERLVRRVRRRGGAVLLHPHGWLLLQRPGDGLRRRVLPDVRRPGASVLCGDRERRLHEHHQAGVLAGARRSGRELRRRVRHLGRALLRGWRLRDDRHAAPPLQLPGGWRRADVPVRPLRLH